METTTFKFNISETSFRTDTKFLIKICFKPVTLLDNQIVEHDQLSLN
jgi:hypothetical protein